MIKEEWLKEKELRITQLLNENNKLIEHSYEDNKKRNEKLT